eukprot:TRINITY_DN3449_c0_g1_i1.p1 TRINITY_DN3449_c0_g1~~TRINITY_DN3449_c0_g1_i1.p1  ORF type:complete len:569 (-),score=73.72 TRINITY_DN3449_c0_g1_i1:80-1786(-)
MKRNNIIRFTVLLVLLQVFQIQAVVQWTGVNLAGAEFDGNTPFWPTTMDMDYFYSKKMNVFRIPFKWERLQPTLMQDFDAINAEALDSVVSYATGKGIWILLDVHNYARYNGKAIGAGVTNEQFADLWTRLANRYKSNDKVLFGLMNEPKDMPSLDWRNGAQAAVNAIRLTGATNYIMLPGNGYTGAWSWFLGAWDGAATNPQANSQIMPTVWDPLSRMIYEVHQYFDDGSSGTSSTCKAAPIGNSTLEALTFWLRENNARAFLGEFGVANNPDCLQALRDSVKHMDDNSDVWLGWTYWAAGNKWGDYMFSLQPTDNFATDRPQMAVLQPYLHGLGAVSINIPKRSTSCVNQTIYDEKLRNGWQNWSWAPTNLADTTQHFSGTRSISFTLAENAFSALSLSLDQATLLPNLYSGIEFYINGAPNGGQKLRYNYRRNKTDIGTSVGNVASYLSTAGTSIPKTWMRVNIPLTANNINVAYSQLVLGSSISAAQQAVYVDSMKLICVDQPMPSDVVTLTPSGSVQNPPGSTSQTPTTTNQPSAQTPGTKLTSVATILNALAALVIVLIFAF